MISALIAGVLPLLDKFIPDAGEKAKLAQEIATLAERQAHELALAQIEVNKEESKSDDPFKSRWRPFIGWVCGSAFAWHFVGQPVVIFSLTIYGMDIPDLPQFEMGTLLTVLGGLLGLGGLRSYEKIQGKA